MKPPIAAGMDADSSHHQPFYECEQLKRKATEYLDGNLRLKERLVPDIPKLVYT